MAQVDVAMGDQDGQNLEELLKHVIAVIDDELARALREKDLANVPSPACQEALGAAAANRLLALAVDALLCRAIQLFSDLSIPRFWASVRGWEREEDHPALIAALQDVAAQVHTLQRAVTAALEFIKSQQTEGLANDRRTQQLLEEGPRVLTTHLGRRLTESTRDGDGRTFEDFICNFLDRCFELVVDVIEGDATGNIRAAAEALQEAGAANVLAVAQRRVLKGHVERDCLAILNDSAGEAVLERLLRTVAMCYEPFLVALGDPAPAATAAAVAHKALGEALSGCLFDLVIDYPDSLPALQDLKTCLAATPDGYRRLVAVFGGAVRQRLLHPGAATADIIHHYVSTIRAMRHIDQSGTILDLVSLPLKEYLRSRKDAIRCIVTMLTEDEPEGEGPGFLAELEAEGEGYDPDADFYGSDCDEQALKEIEEERWEPPPLILPGPRTRRLVPPGDVVGQVVNIYGSKELFVTEYRSMLADRLLAKTDFDCDRELRTLELLKVRFGEAALHAAEVMLRDLADSKRINANVRAVSNTATPLKSRAPGELVGLDGFGVTVVSELYWPQLPAEDFKLPRDVAAMMSTFGAKYHAVKAPRELRWKPGLGTVSLTLSVGGDDVEFNVSPLHAAILLQFQEHAEWAPPALAEALGVAPDLLRHKIVFWINQGVILEVRDETSGGGLIYRRNEEGLAAAGGAAGMDMDEEGGGGGGSDVDMMAHFEPFVLGMLTNFDSLPLDRIHNMLKMFVTEPPYDRTPDQLATFLGRMAAEDKIVLEGGLYKKRNL